MCSSQRTLWGQLSELHSIVQCTFFSITCALYSVQHAMRSVKGTHVQGKVFSVQCTMYNVQSTVYSVQFYSVQCTMYSIQCTLYSVQRTVYSVQCTVVDYRPQTSGMPRYIKTTVTFLQYCLNFFLLLLYVTKLSANGQQTVSTLYKNCQ